MNKVILGTANFNNEYRGIKIEEDDCFKILEEFERLGGEIIQTGYNYGKSSIIIQEYKKQTKTKLKTIYKLNNKGLLYFNNEIVGHSIYYPFQLYPTDKIVIIPNCNIFDPYLPIMKLHSEIYVRSNYTINKENQIQNKHFIDAYIIGVENKKQLIENMEFYNV